jgi:hypothetical protein
VNGGGGQVTNPAARPNRDLVVQALVDAGAVDIGKSGVCFLFASHNMLQTAKHNLNDINHAGECILQPL